MSQPKWSKKAFSAIKILPPKNCPPKNFGWCPPPPPPKPNYLSQFLKCNLLWIFWVCTQWSIWPLLYSPSWTFAFSLQVTFMNDVFALTLICVFDRCQVLICLLYSDWSVWLICLLYSLSVVFFEYFSSCTLIFAIFKIFHSACFSCCLSFFLLYFDDDLSDWICLLLFYCSIFQFSYIFFPVHLHLLACILISVSCIYVSSCFSNFVMRMNLNLYLPFHILMIKLFACTDFLRFLVVFYFLILFVFQNYDD